MIADDVVDQVSAQADIVAIIGEHVKLKKTGSVWRGPCPFHQGKGPNFSVVPHGGYRCFVCGEKGSVFTFVQKRLGMSFTEAVKYVGEKCGVEVKEVERKREGPDPREPMWELHATVAEFFTHCLWEAPEGKAAREYLASRDVGRDTADRFALGYAPRDVNAMRQHLTGLGMTDQRLLESGLLVQREEYPDPRPRFRDRLIFPIHDITGHTVGFGGRLLGPGEPKYLNSAESSIFSKGQLLFNLGAARHAIRKAQQAIIVEGYFDALRLVEAGIEHVVAPMGTALTDQQAELLTRFAKQVVLLYDSDGPGQKATFRAADVLLGKGMEVRVVTLPDGEDPDTFVKSQGRGPAQQLIADAMDVFDRKVQLLERAGWFKDLQHKRRALDRLLPTIRATSDPMARDLYIAKAAEASGVTRETLLNEVHALRRSGRTAPRGTRAVEAVSSGASNGVTRTPGGSEVVGEVRVQRPYRSPVEQANAEATLIRVLLTQPVHQDEIFEELGKLEAEELPGGTDAVRELEEENDGILRDPVFCALYEAATRYGAEADPELFTSGLDPQAIAVYEEFRADPDAIVNAKRSIAESVRALRARSLDARVRTLESLLPLAADEEKDAINLSIKQLADEKRTMGSVGWGAVRKSRA